MPARFVTLLVLSLASVLGLGACERPRDRERRESLPGETRTRSGEVPREPRHLEEERTAPSRLTETPTESPERAPALTSAPDSGRLSIIGTAADRERNLGLVTADGGAAATAPAPPPAPAPAPAEESPSPPTQREGAGRPGAGGDPYQ